VLRKTLLAGLVAGAAAVIVTGPGVFAAGGTPADKVVAAASRTEVIAPGDNVSLMKATMKTSKPTDLLIQTAAECTILTRLVTNNDNNTAMAHSAVHVWVEFDGKVVPLQSTSTPPQDPTAQPPGDKAKDGATFCDREYGRTVTDQEDPADGIDQEDDYIRTKSAHAFNWIRMNTGSGEHTIEVKADLSATDPTASSQAEAIVGNRTLIVEPTKMANNAVISDSGTSGSGSGAATTRMALTKKEQVKLHRLLRRK
jgi:hypothetical protein